jgi:hypothetical protein
VAFESKERAWILLWCCLAAVRVFIYSAAFPFFNNVDEEPHFDLVVRYSQGMVPRAMETTCAEAIPYIMLFGSPEYFSPPSAFPDGRIPPPPWTQPVEKAAPWLHAVRNFLITDRNHECSQQPLYYALAGLWWRLNQVCGFHDGSLLYSVRFLNLFIVGALVWVGYATTRLVFPDQPFLRLGVPALLAFFPQTAFFAVQNDVLSPLSFGVAFLCLLKWLRADVPHLRLGVATGLALATVFLTKLSNLPLLVVAFMAVAFKTWQLVRAGQCRPAFPALAALALTAALPIGAWLVRTKLVFGDFTGSAAKIQFLGWTYKSFGDWWAHPLFTPAGLWTFLSGLIATFWQGELFWHRRPMILPAVSSLYAVLSIGLVALALAYLLRRPANLTGPQRQTLWLSFWSCLSAVGFLGFLSIIYDFHACVHPSREQPYFNSGRLMLGALIPFLLLSLFGMDRALSRFKSRWIRPLFLVGMILFMLIAEIIANRPAFFSAYNWFHM